VYGRRCRPVVLLSLIAKSPKLEAAQRGANVAHESALSAVSKVNWTARADVRVKENCV
jgi:hypothetical protein